MDTWHDIEEAVLMLQQCSKSDVSSAISVSLKFSCRNCLGDADFRDIEQMIEHAVSCCSNEKSSTDDSASASKKASKTKRPSCVEPKAKKARLRRGRDVSTDLDDGPVIHMGQNDTAQIKSENNVATPLERERLHNTRSTKSKALVLEAESGESNEKYVEEDEKEEDEEMKEGLKDDIALRMCPKCQKLLETSEACFSHLETEHGFKIDPHERVGENKLKCSICQKVFLKKNINRHVLGIHARGTLRDFLCYICGTKFRSQGNLSEHIKRHLGLHKRDVRKTVFQCDKCCYSTPEKIRLKRHMQSKHEGIFQFKCSHCSYKTWDNSSFKSHVWKHSSVKKFHCKECTYQCNQLKQLRNHLLNKHDTILPKSFYSTGDRIRYLSSGKARQELTEVFKSYIEKESDLKLPKEGENEQNTAKDDCPKEEEETFILQKSTLVVTSGEDADPKGLPAIIVKSEPHNRGQLPNHILKMLSQNQLVANLLNQETDIGTSSVTAPVIDEPDTDNNDG